MRRIHNHALNTAVGQRRLVKLVGHFFDVLVTVHLDLKLVRVFSLAVANSLALVFDDDAKIRLLFIDLSDSKRNLGIVF